MVSSKSAIFFVPLLTSVLAVNDWSQPCFDGVCEYSLPSTNGSSGSLKIWGSPNAITDITTAAGWNIVSCDSEKTTQDIRLVCTTDESSSGCAHLYQNNGAEGKVARLPENCGKGPFARIAKAYIPDDQSIPKNVAKRLLRRDGAPPQVKALSLDTNFGSIDASKAGTINIAILGANVPGVPDGISEDEAPTKSINSRILHPRLFGFIEKAASKVGSAVSSAVNTAKTAATGAAKTVASDAKKVVNTASTAAKKVVNTADTAAKKVVSTADTAAKKVVDTADTAAKKVATTAVNDAKAGTKAVVGAAKAVESTAAKDVKAGASAVVGAAKAVGSGAADAAGAVADATKDAAGAVADATKDAAGAVADAAGTAANVGGKVLDAVTGQDINLNTGLKSLPPIDVDKSVNLLDKSIDCGPVKAGVKIDVDAKAHAVVAVGVAASGTLVPPNLDKFQITSTLNANLDSSITMAANVEGSISSPDLQLFSIGIPGLDFPGILSIGPTFTINANAVASLDLDVDLTVGVNYNINQAKLVFPPDGSKGGAFDLGDTPLKLSATPSASATGKIEAHLIPSLNLGISALGDTAQATVFLNLDAEASMTLSVAATGPAVNAQVGRREPEPLALPEPEIPSIDARANVPAPVPKPVPKKTTTTANTGGGASDAASDAADKNAATSVAAKAATTGAAEKSTTNTAAKASTSGAATVNSGASKSKTQVTIGGTAAGTGNQAATSSSTASKPKVSVGVSGATFGGCFSVDAGLSVNAGADADFFSLFNAGTKVTLFQKDFNLFKKCFGNQAKRALLARGWTRLERDSRRALEKRGFSCPKADNAAEQSVADETVAASAATAE